MENQIKQNIKKETDFILILSTIIGQAVIWMIIVFGLSSVGWAVYQVIKFISKII